MALENQTFKAPAIPKMGKNIVSSSVFSGVSKSIKSPQLKKSKIKFSPLTTTKKTDVEKLKGDTKKDEQKIQSTKTLQETNLILAEIQNQLALDYANRILERKQRILASRKVQRKQKLKEKEDFVEKGPKFSAIKNTFDKITSPIRSIFDKLLDFLTLVGGGILLNKAWEWLSDPENRKKFIDTIKFLTDHWKWIVGAIVGAKLLKGIFKLIGFLGKIRKLINIFRKKPPNTGGGRRGGKTNPNNPSGGCGPVTGKGGCLDQLSATSETAKNLAKTLFATAFAVGYFKRLVPKAAPAKEAPASAPLQLPGEKEQEQQQPPLTTDKPSKKTEPIILKSFTGREIPQELSDVLDLLQREYKRTGKDQSALTEKGFLQVKATARNRLGLLGLGGPDLTPQISFNPKLTPKSNEEAIAAATALFTIANLPATLAPFAAGKGAVTRVIRSASKRSGLNNYRAPNVQNFGTAAAKKSAGNNVLQFPMNRIRKDADKQIAAQMQTEFTAVRKRGYDTDQTIEILSKIKEFKDILIAPSPVLRSEGGTIPGKGSPIVDSVSAMLAPGEEVIRTASSNMFRPVLKDINDNAGRLFTDFEKGTFLQEKQILLSKNTNKSFGESAEKFDEIVEKLLRKQQKEKEDRLRDKIRDAGGIVRVLNRMGLAGQTNNPTGSTIRQHNDPRNPIGEVVGGPEYEPVINTINNQPKQFEDVLTLNVTPKAREEPPIRTYTANNNRSSNTSPTFATLPLPAQVLADQGNPPPPIQSDDVSAEPLITNMSVDPNNPAIAEAFQDYGIFT